MINYRKSSALLKILLTLILFTASVNEKFVPDSKRKLSHVTKTFMYILVHGFRAVVLKHLVSFAALFWEHCMKSQKTAATESMPCAAGGNNFLFLGHRKNLLSSCKLKNWAPRVSRVHVGTLFAFFLDHSLRFKRQQLEPCLKYVFIWFYLISYWKPVGYMSFNQL